MAICHTLLNTSYGHEYRISGMQNRPGLFSRFGKCIFNLSEKKDVSRQYGMTSRLIQFLFFLFKSVAIVNGATINIYPGLCQVIN